MIGRAKNERKKTASPGGTASAVALIRLAMHTKVLMERIFRTMPRRGCIGSAFQRHISPLQRGSKGLGRLLAKLFMKGFWRALVTLA